MELTTRHFGRIEVDEKSIIFFPRGLVAFQEMKKYILILNEDKENPLHCLQSLDDPNLSFTVINPFLFKKDYDFMVSSDDQRELSIEEKNDVTVFAIVVLQKDIKKITANLLAPLVINHRDMKGKQIILNDKKYSTKHCILDELQKNRGVD